MIVIINGVSGSGKDEFVKCVSSLGIIDVYNRSTIDPIKEAMKCLGWNGERTPENRQMMVGMKQLWIKWNRFSCTDYVNNIYDAYKPFNDKCIVFVHCREPEEITKIVKRMPDVKTLLIKGRGIAYENGADNIVEDFEYDYYVDNDGTIDDLRKEADIYLKATKMFYIKGE